VKHFIVINIVFHAATFDFRAGLWAGRSGLWGSIPGEGKYFSLQHRFQNGSGVHPASYPMGTSGSFPGVKAAGREADHSPPSRAEVKE
jgi:hypothetical protein